MRVTFLLTTLSSVLLVIFRSYGLIIHQPKPKDHNWRYHPKYLCITFRSINMSSCIVLVVKPNFENEKIEIPVRSFPCGGLYLIEVSNNLLWL